MLFATQVRKRSRWNSTTRTASCAFWCMTMVAGLSLRCCIRDARDTGDSPVCASARRELAARGLSGMREGTERIGGQLKLWSGPAAGTEIELVVPGPIAFVAGAKSDEDPRT